jgi:hypothetical protein
MFFACLAEKTKKMIMSLTKKWNRELGTGGSSYLSSYYFGRLRLGGARFETSMDKKFMRFHLQNNHSKMNLRWGSNGRIPALQV